MGYIQEQGSVLQHATGGQYLGGVADGINAGQYYRVAKADGGYDYYRVMPNGYDVQLTSEQDVGVALGADPLSLQPIYNEGTDTLTGTNYAGGSQGLTVEEIASRVAAHNANLKEIDRAYQEGLLTFQERQQAIDQSRSSLGKQKDQGIESNSAYFNAVSPDAFQSQIGNYNQKVLDAYTEGSKTADNNQASLDFAKQNFEGRTADSRAAEMAFNPTSGQYNYGNGYSANSLVSQAPTLQAVGVNPAQMSAGQIPQWAPNYGGLSTMQKAKENTDPLTKYLGA